MARRTSQESRLTSIVSEHVERLVSALSQAIRQDVADEVQAYFASGGDGKLGFLRPRRRLGCIAPGCKNTSKGPRFHYLCEKHLDAPKKDYEAWRKAKKESAQQI